MAAGRPLAEAFVRISPDDSGFGRKLKKQMESAAGPASKVIDRALVKKLGVAIEDANRKVAKSNLDVRATELSLTEARAKLTAVTEDANATDSQRAKATIAVERAELKHADALAGVRKAQDGARTSSAALTKALAGQNKEAKEAEDSTRGFGRELRGAFAGGSIDVRQLQTFAQKIRDIRVLSSATIAPIKNMAEQVGRMAVVAGVASAAIVGGVGLSGGVLALAGALAQVAGAAPVAVAGVGALAAVFATVKAATLGVSDGIGQVVAANATLAAGQKLTKAETEKLNASLKTLAPSARGFVLAIGAMLPALRRTQQAIQQRFFAHLGTDIKLLGERYIPTLTRGGKELASVLGGGVHAALRALNNSTTQWNLAAVISSASAAAKTFSPVIARIPVLLVNIAAAAAPAFRSLAKSAAGALGGIVTRLQAAVDSGALARGVDKGIAAFKSLGSIVHSVFSIIHSAVTAASAVIGGNLLKSVGDVAKKFADFLKSAQGQDALRAVFAAALPVLAHLGGLLQIVGPQLAALAPVVLRLADAFIAGLRPVIPVAAELAKTLGTALTSVLPAVSELAVALGSFLTKAIQTVQPVIGPLADAVGSLLSPTGLLQEVLASLAPVLVPLARGLGHVVTALSGGLIAALDAVAPKLPALVDAFTRLAAAVADGLADALTAVLPLLPTLVQQTTDLLNAFTPLIPVIVAVAKPLITFGAAVVTLVGPVGILAGLLGTFATAARAASGGMEEQGTWVTDLNNKWDLLAAGIGAGDGSVAVAATHMNQFGEKVNDATGKVLDEKSAVDQLRFALDELNGKSISAAEAQIAFKDSLTGLETAVKNNGRSLNLNTQAGRNVETAFINAAKSAQSLGEAVGDQKGYAAGRAAIAKSRGELQALGVRLGLSKTQVQDLITQFLKVPPVKRTDIELRIEAAKKRAAEIRRSIGSVVGKSVSIEVSQNGTVQRVQREINAITGRAVSVTVGLVRGNLPKGMSAGGEVTGGIPGRDSVPALLMPGEQVLTVAQARAWRAGRTPPSVAGVLGGPAAPASGGGGGFDPSGIAAAVRAGLDGMAFRFDGDGLARLVTGKQAYAAAAGGRR